MRNGIDLVYKVAGNSVELNETVLILMSTYNGERFLREQLDSIIHQKKIDVKIIVRDDGSSDLTPEILREYSNEYKCISYFTGEHEGVVKSFEHLATIALSQNEKYFAFCDQDDVWLDEKLVIAVSSIIELEKNIRGIPIVYCSNLIVTDENGFSKGAKRKILNKYTLCMALVQNIGSGCTQVFNKSALKMFCKGIGKRMEMHDYWMTLVGMYCGRIIYDNNAHILYRQHDKNVVGVRKKALRKFVRNMRNETDNNRINMLSDFVDIYYISGENKKIIEDFVYYNKSIRSRLRLIISTDYCGYEMLTTIGFKIRVILAKII